MQTKIGNNVWISGDVTLLLCATFKNILQFWVCIVITKIVSNNIVVVDVSAKMFNASSVKEINFNIPLEKIITWFTINTDGFSVSLNYLPRF